MSEKVIHLSSSYRKPPSGGGSEPPMELIERVSHLEIDMRDVRDRLAKIESKLESFATKSDLYQAINNQTWKLVTFVCGFGTALVAAVYIATHT